MKRSSNSKNYRYEDLIIRLNSVRLLRSLKNFLKYGDMEKILDIPKSILSRYINGSILPSKDRAEMIYERCINEGFLREIIKKNILEGDEVHDPYLSYLFSSLVLKYCSNVEANKVAVFFPNDIF